MNAYVAATDPDWFQFLSMQQDVDEVNFWYPKPWGGHFRVLSPGQPLLFKLKRPYNHIAGGGYFRHYWEVPLSIAWEAFGTKNGAATHLDVWRSIKRLRREVPRAGDDPVIGCVLLVEPFFWPRELWIEEPLGWHPNIQRGRTYDLRIEEGRQLWTEVLDRMRRAGSSVAREPQREAPAAVEVPGGYGDSFLQPRRLGQGTFRALVTDVYERRCAITREKALPALDAAHIQPFSEVRAHSVRNGILLRSDVHKLFDAGYVTITPEYRVEASRRMKEDFDDGDNYLSLHGSSVWVPKLPSVQPDAEALQWHNENRYRG